VFSVAVGLALMAWRVKLALHHVEEDRDGGLAQFRLGQQRHLQEGPHHGRHEVDLVLAQVEPHGPDLEAHLATHIAVARQHLAPFALTERFDLQRRLRHERDRAVKVIVPHLLQKIRRINSFIHTAE